MENSSHWLRPWRSDAIGKSRQTLKKAPSRGVGQELATAWVALDHEEWPSETSKDAALVLLVEHIQRRLNNPQFGSIMVGGTIGAADGDENSDPLVDASSS
jgi:hypothetical protein